MTFKPFISPIILPANQSDNRPEAFEIVREHFSKHLHLATGVHPSFPSLCLG